MKVHIHHAEHLKMIINQIHKPENLLCVLWNPFDAQSKGMIHIWCKIVFKIITDEIFIFSQVGDLEHTRHAGWNTKGLKPFAWAGQG